jgi:hypothetical protein
LRRFTNFYIIDSEGDVTVVIEADGQDLEPVSSQVAMSMHGA